MYLRDINGKSLNVRKDIRSEKIVINAKNYKAGIYYVCLYGDKGTKYQEKIIIR